MARLVFLILSLVVAHVASTEVNVSPVQKVIELLDTLKAKVETDTAKETNSMEEYVQYCDMEAKDTEFAIKTGEREIEDIQATIEDCEGRVVEYANDIETISSTIAAKEEELAEAVKIREEGHADFVATEKDLLATADEMTRAQIQIKKDMSFAQLRGSSQPSKQMEIYQKALAKVVNAEWLDVGSKKRITQFLQNQNKQGDTEGESELLSLKDKELQLSGQPQASVSEYDSHTGGILDTVTDMAEKTQESLSEARKKEMKAAHSFEMIKMNLNDGISLLKSKLSEATQAKSVTLEQSGKAKGEKAGFAKSLDADKKYLLSLNTECQAKSEEWEARKDSAEGELKAIAKAREILSTGVSAALIQMPIEEESSKKAAKRAQLTDVLRQLAKKFHSYALMEMASRASADPFAKVKGLIEDMVTKLTTEANEEASHKSFCDEEMSTSKKSVDEKVASMDEFQARMDRADTTSSSLDEQVKVLQREIADIDVAQKEAARVREEEKGNYLKTVGDYRASAEAVAQAIEVLKKYYEGESLIQIKAHGQTNRAVSKVKQPAFGEKKSDSANSIISVLEMAEADFTKLVAEAETQENESVDAFRKLQDEDEIAKVAKTAAVKGKLSEIKTLKVSLDHYRSDHSAVGKELDAVTAYIEKLKPECESKVMTYEERKARREAEIEGLKEALSILEGDSVAVVF